MSDLEQKHGREGKGVDYLKIIRRRQSKYCQIIRRGDYSTKFTEPEADNCFSIILRCGHQKVKKKKKKRKVKLDTKLSSRALKCYFHRIAR